MDHNRYEIIKLQNSLLNNGSFHNKYHVRDLQANVNAAINKGQGVSWITLQKSLKLVNELDKSRIIKGMLEKHSDIVVKLGDSRVANEIDIASRLKKKRGFIRFIGSFHCADDYLEDHTLDMVQNHDGIKRKQLCKGKEKTMSSIVMPYYPEGSIGRYRWSKSNVHILRSLLKQTLMFILNAYDTDGLIHGDLHVDNILIAETYVANVHCTFSNGQRISIETHGKTPIIMDFEYSKFTKMSKMDNMMFLTDINKWLWTMTPPKIENLDPSIIHDIGSLVTSININMKDPLELVKAFHMIDKIDVMR